MTIAQGFVLLSDQDADAVDLPCVATVSKDEVWDHGGLPLGVTAASSGRLWLDRPYFTGNPAVPWLVQHADRCTTAGGWAQLGNELNLPMERWEGGREAWFALEDRVRAGAQHPDRLLAMPPSPGVAGWQDWVRHDDRPQAIHAYGSFGEMRAIVEWYLTTTTGPLFVTECNFAAGRSVDRDAWAEGELRPFLDWCAAQPRVRAVAYFAWRWRIPDSALATPLDAAGTAIERVIRTWTPPEEKTVPTTNPWREKILTVWNLPPDPAVLLAWGAQLGLAGFEIKTADGDSSWVDSQSHPQVTRAYVDALRAGGRYRVMGWSYNYCDLVTGNPSRGDGVPEAEAAAAARGVADLGLDGHTFDLEIESEGHADLVAIMLAEARRRMERVPLGAHTWAYRHGHERYAWDEIKAGVDVLRPMIYRDEWNAARSWEELGDWYAGALVCPVWGITDAGATAEAIAEDHAIAEANGCPGVAFWELSGLPGQAGVADWIAELACGEPEPEPEPPPATEVEPVRARTWALLDELQALGADWRAVGWPGAAIGVESGAEVIKRLIGAGKGER